MAAKVLRAEYYWATVQGDCTEFVRKCLKCQEYGTLSHKQPKKLTLHPISLAVREMGNGYRWTLRT